MEPLVKWASEGNILQSEQMNSDGHSKDNKHKLHNLLVPCWVQLSKQKKCISRKDKFKYDPELTPWGPFWAFPKNQNSSVSSANPSKPI
jgi:hypothetical protein